MTYSHFSYNLNSSEKAKKEKKKKTEIKVSDILQTEKKKHHAAKSINTVK